MGKPSATGRDGEVTVTGRAMIDENGVVQLEVTTGELDTEDSPPGNLSKLQLKALYLDNAEPENPMWVKNYNGLREGGYASFIFEDLSYGQPIFIHANVRGIIRGTAVVQMTEEVKYRPDLGVVISDIPEEAYVGDPVFITAQVMELKGDLGARANCVLYADGEKLDEANGIWVDAGDQVACAFTTVFEEAGMKQITVAVEDIVPGDYSLAQNVAEAQIEIIEERTNDFYWTASARIDLEPFITERSNSFSYSYESGYHQYAQVQGSKWNTYFGFPMEISASLSSGGHDWIDQYYAEVNSNRIDRSGRSCFQDYLPFNTIMYICDANEVYSNFTVYIRRYAENIVYYSNSGSHTIDHQLLEYGEDLSFDVQISGGGENISLIGSIDLEEHTVERSYTTGGGWLGIVTYVYESYHRLVGNGYRYPGPVN